MLARAPQGFVLGSGHGDAFRSRVGACGGGGMIPSTAVQPPRRLYAHETHPRTRPSAAKLGRSFGGLFVLANERVTAWAEAVGVDVPAAVA